MFLLILKIIGEDILYIEAEVAFHIGLSSASIAVSVPMDRAVIYILHDINIFRSEDKLIGKLVPKLIVGLEVTKGSSGLHLHIVVS